MYDPSLPKAVLTTSGERIKNWLHFLSVLYTCQGWQVAGCIPMPRIQISLMDCDTFPGNPESQFPHGQTTYHCTRQEMASEARVMWLPCLNVESIEIRPLSADHSHHTSHQGHPNETLEVVICLQSKASIFFFDDTSEVSKQTWPIFNLHPKVHIKLSKLPSRQGSVLNKLSTKSSPNAAVWIHYSLHTD